MAQVIWSKRAVRNLQIIWLFYAEKSHNAADNVVKGITKTGNALLPNILHQSEKSLKPDQYRAIYRHFKIVYKIKAGKVLILQIFDSRQDPSKLKP